MKKRLLFVLAALASVCFMNSGAIAYDGTPFGGVARTIPGKIQAEEYDDGGEGVAYHDQDATNNGGTYEAGGNYRPDEGVDINAAITDAEDGTMQIGWFRDQEWLNYTVDVEAGVYDVNLRIGTPFWETILEVYLDDVLLFTYSVDGDDWNPDTYTVSDITIPVGGTGRVLTVKNGGTDEYENDIEFNWIEFVKTADIETSSYTGTPFGGVARTIPGKIEAEEYDDGGEGVAYHDQDETNNGGTYEAGGNYRPDEGVDINAAITDVEDGTMEIGWFRDQEWLNYTVDVEAGVYDVNMRIGTPFWETILEVYLDDELLFTYSVDGDDWTPDTYTVSDITIPVGGTGQVLTVKNGGTDEYENDIEFNWIEFVKTGEVVGVYEKAIEDVSVYPNPVINDVRISNMSGLNKISIFDVTGKKLNELTTTRTDLNISMKEMKSGIYLVQIISDVQLVKSVKVVKK